ncbi:hypothetical protein MKP15_09315 [Stenotrophomonas sp. Y6]|nr:hypothetical protein [Stenotrophomonas sp. Y6]MCH1908977.1 hypothetical protein [Stenotrophomonas sp. Y6]
MKAAVSQAGTGAAFACVAATGQVVFVAGRTATVAAGRVVLARVRGGG